MVIAKTTRFPGSIGNRADKNLLEFTRHLIRLRKDHPVFHRRRWFQGRPIHGAQVTDIGWFTPDGAEMAEEHWNEGFAKAMGIFLNGEGIQSPDARGERVIDDSFYVLFNAHHEPLQFTLPKPEWGYGVDRCARYGSIFARRRGAALQSRRRSCP